METESRDDIEKGGNVEEEQPGVSSRIGKRKATEKLRAEIAEGQPLLMEHKSSAYGADKKTDDDDAIKVGSTMSSGSRFISHHTEVVDSMTYQAKELTTWSSLLMMSYTVWNRKSLWLVTLKLFGLATVVAVIVLMTITDPASLRVSKFTKISDFLRVFVGLLLGFFMSASVNRWWNCAQGFHNLCASIRTLHIMTNSLGVPEDLTLRLLRYGVSSAWVLHNQLHVEALPLAEQDSATKKFWEALDSGAVPCLMFVKLDEYELEMLRDMSDPPGTLWMWMGSFVGYMAEDGVIPGHATATFGALMAVIREGFNAIRDVRSSISVQAPFIYVQMLSSLVHINNIVNAVSFGLTSGASIGTLLVHWKVFQVLPAVQGKKPEASSREAAIDLQTLLVSFFFSCFGPFVYQALLEVSIAIAQPFSNKDAVVPTERILGFLQKDLLDALRAAKQISWRQPCFQTTQK
jgi:predicted membrane chloride channel (bestrophin family)